MRQKGDCGTMSSQPGGHLASKLGRFVRRNPLYDFLDYARRAFEDIML